MNANIPYQNMHDFNFSNDGTTATVSLSTYAFFVAREWGGSFPAQINRWIPTNPSLINLPYSLHIVDSNQVGITETDIISNTVIVYPNPSDGFVWINITLDKPQSVHVSIIDIVGQMVSENQKESLNSGNQRVLLSCENLANGTYLVRVDLSGRIITKKIIVNH